MTILRDLVGSTIITFKLNYNINIILPACSQSLVDSTKGRVGSSDAIVASRVLHSWQDHWKSILPAATKA